MGGGVVVLWLLGHAYKFIFILFFRRCRIILVGFTVLRINTHAHSQTHPTEKTNND